MERAIYILEPINNHLDTQQDDGMLLQRFAHVEGLELEGQLQITLDKLQYVAWEAPHHAIQAPLQTRPPWDAHDD
jgi:hypothetical protein